MPNSFMDLTTGCCLLPGEDVPDRGFQNKAQQDVHCSRPLPFFFGVLIHQGEQSYDPVIPALLPGIPWDLGMAVRTPVLFGLAVSVKNPLLHPGVENESLV